MESTRFRLGLVVALIASAGLTVLGIAGQAAEPNRAAAPQEPPRIIHVAPVAPDILGIEIQAGRVLPMRHVPYQKEPGDRVETRQTNPRTGEPREVRLIRNGRTVGFLIGPDRKVLNVFERLVGEPLNVGLADQPQTYSLTSPDDPVYLKGQTPAAVWRKSKSNNWSDPDLLFTTRHWVYLKLPAALSVGKRYFARFPNLNLDVPAVDFVHDPETLRSEAVHASQIGFRPDDAGKAAFLSIWLGTGGAHPYAPRLQFFLIDERTGKRVHTGEVVTAWRAADAEQIGRKRNHNLTDVFRMDFGDFTRPGRYRVCVEGVGCSYPFEIGADVWRKAFLLSMKGSYHQRNGVTLQPPYTDFVRPRGYHPDDGVKVYQSTCPILYSGNGLNALGRDRDNFGGLVAGKTDQVVPGIWGGYMDAGDWDRRIQHLSASRLHLELMELSPEFFRATSLNIPESGNDLPDLVDEALFNIDCYRRLQTPEGGVRGGIESSEHPVAGETSWLESQTVLTYAPDPWSSYLYAGLAARAAHVLRQLGSSLAPVYETSALRAMRWAESDYRKWQQGPDYAKVRPGAKREVAQERNLAAVELYRLTRDKTWHDLLAAAASSDDSEAVSFLGQPDAAFVYARLDDALVDPSLKLRAVQAVVQAADRAIQVSRGNAFGITMPWIGGFSGAFSVPARPEIVRAHVLTGKPQYLEAILRSSLFSSGANPMNITMTTGVGHDWPRNILHEDARHSGQEAPIGITVYGPADLRDVDWAVRRLEKECTPPATKWPVVEGYFDIYLWAPVCEYTVHQTLGPTSYVWGYLAARR